MPRDTGDWVGIGSGFYSTPEVVLEDLGLTEQDELIQDISGSILNDTWVEAAGGYFYGLHQHEIWGDSWSNFCELVKHRVRYFFHFEEDANRKSNNSLSPEDMLYKLIESLKGTDGFKKKGYLGSSIFRARIKNDHWAMSESEMRQTPNSFATAGRMNPAGISYFYASEEVETAIAEVCKCKAEVAVARFEMHGEVNFLDMTKIIDLPLLFDPTKRELSEQILFLRGFIDDISKPIAKDGREHIEYVPTQIVTELLARQVKGDGKSIDGIRFKSSVKEGGINWVFFPSAFEKIKYAQADVVEVDLDSGS
ncbi:MAG: hypothetical protein COZ36_06665 [Piscirickettsiaceae bacterium CG_4_10_14_3_um_filter_44_349]|nr:MAG: hypothetical protein COW76_19050 [Shewanella sp. CG18_big_fil_WC_8_21_14_2_50_42_11]PIX78852.1 MAG: hypothetical protein COZ36_06665 [Piscirickettsiaceae bacterium CG_4_10_14_3_um_filter_44_349]